ncbi:MAG: glycosyltransferase family 2 protein [Gammaproteobacteria bacterium]|nr:glycosyltransferase family 2 protein [Gammaproteobacteria bacterium]
MGDELVSVAIPTFNRPEGLKTNIESVLKQSYKNLEIIVADNCSENPLVSKLIHELMQQDNRIKYYRHYQNLGAGVNLKFLLSRVSGNFFMWLADDDYLISENFFKELMKYAPSNILTFSDHRTSISNSDNCSNIYADCQSKLDYLYAWLGNGGGAPIYGLYNRQLMKEKGITFSFDNDLSYYNEGTMLHKLFLSGLVKFVPDIFVFFDRNSGKPSLLELCKSFVEYYDRTVQIIMSSDLEESEKRKALQIIHQHNSPYFFGLFRSLQPIEQQDIFVKILEKGFIRI